MIRQCYHHDGERASNRLHNAQDQLPGRLRGLQISESRNAGPVNCIPWLGPIILNVAFSFVPSLGVPPEQKCATPLFLEPPKIRSEHPIDLLKPLGCAQILWMNQTILCGHRMPQRGTHSQVTE